MMRLATFNANSIRARLPIITQWLEREKPDLLCLQETKVQDGDFPARAFEAQGYGSLYRGQKAYNGVAIISRIPPQDVERDLHGEGDAEARFIRATVAGVPIINVYVPQGFAPGTDKFAYKLRWLQDLLVYVKGRFDPGDPLLLVGDFNVALEPIDLYDPQGLEGEAGYHPDERSLMRRFLDWGLVDLFRRHHPGGGHYTFWDYRIPHAFKRRLGWRIDYILVTEPLAQRCTKIWIDAQPRTLPKPSDHTFLVAEFDRAS
jgi:exodeoxyribonuclease-3